MPLEIYPAFSGNNTPGILALVLGLGGWGDGEGSVAKSKRSLTSVTRFPHRPDGAINDHTHVFPVGIWMRVQEKISLTGCVSSSTLFPFLPGMGAQSCPF